MFSRNIFQVRVNFSFFHTVVFQLTFHLDLYRLELHGNWCRPNQGPKTCQIRCLWANLLRKLGNISQRQNCECSCAIPYLKIKRQIFKDLLQKQSIWEKIFEISTLCTVLGSLIGNFDYVYSTVWKFSYFPVTPLILREINFGSIQKVKTAVLTILKALSFDFLGVFDIYICQNWFHLKSEWLENC